MIITSMNLVGCGIELFIINRVGRRTLLLGGQASLITCLIIVGILGCVPGTDGVHKGLGAILAIINLVFHITLGPVVYSIAAELPSSRLRARTIALGRMFYICNGVILNQLTPRMIAIDKWNWGPKCGFFWAGCNSLWAIWAFFRVPETGGFSYAELEILFSNKVSARKFKHVVVHDEQAEAALRDDKSDADVKVVPVDGVQEQPIVEKA